MTQRDLRARLVERFPRERTYLLPALHYAQQEVGSLPEWALQVIGWHLHVPASEVYGAATSYTELRIKAGGKHLVRVCTGLSCLLNGGQQVLDACRHALGVEPGQTTADGAVTLEETWCAFLCGVAPAIEVDGRHLGRVDAAHAAALLKRLKNGA